MICLGDSIAVGLQCSTTYAQVGIGSDAAVARWRCGNADVISLGSNDPLNPRLEANLRRLRAGCTGRVTWILPRHPRASAIVRAVAASYRDVVVSFVPGADGVHPRSYGELRASL